jgi:hypothetical protein
MKQSSVLFSLFGVVGLAGLLSACGNEGSPSASGSATASGSASASGTITDFGSIYINGKKFESNDVEVIRNGQSSRCSISPSTTCGLKKGMTVTANGSVNESLRTARSVVQRDAVEGLVQSVAADRLVVMGQTVLFDNTTIFDNSFTPVAGTFVEVHGHVRPNGIIQATFIEPKNPAEVTPEVRGYVGNHNDGAKTFRIGNLTVNYGGLSVDISDMPAPSGSNWNDRFVEVKGTVAGFNNATTTLLATKVEQENQGFGNNVDEFEVEGFVTQAGTQSGNIITFTIGTTPVQTTANTEFRGGTIDEIIVGAKLSAEGRLDNGTLIAKHVKFHASVRLEGNATVSGNALTLAGLPGVTISVNGQTELRDGGNTITLNDLNGHHVRGRGRVSGTSAVIATRIELRSPDNDVDLQGTVQAINGNVIVILGVPVDTGTINQFESVSGTSMSRAGFLAAVSGNSLVKVKGELSGTAVVWDEAELED